MTPITLRDLPRRQRARIYAVALDETSADFALAEALAASAKTDASSLTVTSCPAELRNRSSTGGGSS